MFSTFLKCLKILRNLNFWDLISSLAKTTIAFTCLCVCAPHSKHQTYLTLLLRDRDLTKNNFTKIFDKFRHSNFLGPTSFSTKILFDQKNLVYKLFSEQFFYQNFWTDIFHFKSDFDFKKCMVSSGLNWDLFYSSRVPWH